MMSCAKLALFLKRDVLGVYEGANGIDHAGHLTGFCWGDLYNCFLLREGFYVLYNFCFWYCIRRSLIFCVFIFQYPRCDILWCVLSKVYLQKEEC